MINFLIGECIATILILDAALVIYIGKELSKKD